LTIYIVSEALFLGLPLLSIACLIAGVRLRGRRPRWLLIVAARQAPSQYLTGQGARSLRLGWPAKKDRTSGRVAGGGR
jgi:hypothetical protein